MADSPLPLERLSLSAVAQALGVHPFTVARVLGHSGELPPGLRFEPSDVSRVRELAGVESWWSGDEPLALADPERTLALLQALCSKLVDRDVVQGHWTLAENLLRGLDPADQGRLRRVVNGLIRARMLRTRASWRGIEVSVDRDWRDIVVDIAEGGQLPQVVREAWG
jgi:hypothetical protein